MGISYIDFRNNYRNQAYLGNQASAANWSLAKLKYKGERQFFSIETYYSIMTKAFNALQNAGPEHALNKDQKISTFEIGLKNLTQSNIILRQTPNGNCFQPLSPLTIFTTCSPNACLNLWLWAPPPWHKMDKYLESRPSMGEAFITHSQGEAVVVDEVAEVVSTQWLQTFRTIWWSRKKSWWISLKAIQPI